MANRSFVAGARKTLLKRGRALLRAAQTTRTASEDVPDYLAALSDDERGELEEIHAALERIECGRFGRCEICTDAMAEASLENTPWRRACTKCEMAVAQLEAGTAPSA